MSTKIIGLDSLKHIKSYVDRIKGNIKEELDAETKEYLEKGIKDASEAIYKDYDSKYKELTDAIARAEANGDSNLAALKLALDRLIEDTNDEFDALDALKLDYDKLNGKYDDLYEGIKTGNVFSPGQFDEIVRTAMINEVSIGKDQILAPEMLATKMVALIANFGQVQAANLIAGTIKGSSIESTNTMISTGEPVWKIDNAGDGWLACKNIKWDRNGNVTFGPDVKITWESIKDGNSKVNGVLKDYDKNIRDFVANYVSSETAGAASRAELEQAQREAEDAVDNLKTSLEGEIGNLRTDTEKQIEDTVGKVNNFIEVQYSNDKKSLEQTIEATDAALREAYATGNQELIEELEKLRKDLEYEMGNITEEASLVQATLFNVKGELGNLSSSALTKHNADALLSAALITQNEIGDDYIATPSLLAKKIVGLVATFGTVNASKIVGTKIQGYTVSSPTQVKDNEGNIVYEEDKYEYEVDKNGKPVPATDENGHELINPNTGETIYKYATDAITGKKIPIPKELSKDEIAWQLNADGSGHVAERQIRWDYPRIEEGEYKDEIAYPDNVITDAAKREWRRDHVEVTFGPHVTIGWDKVNGGPEALNNAIADASASIREDLNEWASDNNLSPIEQKNLKELYANITKEYDQLIALHKKCEDAKITVEGKNEYDNAYDNFVDAIKHHTRGVYDWENNTSTENTTTIMVNKSGGAGSADLPKDDSRRYENISNYYSAKEIFSSNLNNAVADNAAAIAKNDAIKAANQNIESATGTLTTKIDSTKTALEKAIKEGDGALSTKLAAQLDTQTKQQQALNGLQTSLNNIGTENSGILSPEKIAVLAATVDVGTKITKDQVSSGSILGLVGEFGLVRADQLEGTTISGKTISSTDNASGKDYKKWQLNADGSGWVANKQIEWNADGSTVSLGNNVKIAWENVTDSNKKVNSAITTSLNTFEIQSHKIKGNLIEGKTIESSTDVILQKGTNYYTHGTPNSNGDYTYTSNTANGTNSSGPAWQIRENGEGYLAGGAIRFNKNGITGVNGDQLMDGGLGNSSKLTKLIADNATIGNLEVRKLNTTGEGVYGKETISIENNDMRIFSRSSDNEVVRITGSAMTTIPDTTSTTITKQTKTVNITSPQTPQTVDFGVIGSVNLVEGYNYWSGGNDGGSLPFRFRCTRSNTTNAGSANLVFYIKQSVGDESTYYSNTHGLTVNFTDGADTVDITDSIALANNLINTKNGYNNIYFSIRIENLGGVYNVNDFKITEITLSPNNNSTSVNFVPQISRTDLSASGIRYIQSVDNRFIVNGDEVTAIKKDSTDNKYYGFKLDSKGLRLLYSKAGYTDSYWTGYIRPVRFESNNNTSIDGKEMNKNYATILICGDVTSK